MFKLTIIGVITLASFASAEEGRFLQGDAPRQYRDSDKIPFKAGLGCGACIRGSYIFCIPGAEGSDKSSWPSNLRSTCYENNTTLAAANLAAPWTCSNIYSDPTLAKGFCPFDR